MAAFAGASLPMGARAQRTVRDAPPRPRQRITGLTGHCLSPSAEWVNPPMRQVPVGHLAVARSACRSSRGSTSCQLGRHPTPPTAAPATSRPNDDADGSASPPCSGGVCATQYQVLINHATGRCRDSRSNGNPQAHDVLQRWDASAGHRLERGQPNRGGPATRVASDPVTDWLSAPRTTTAPGGPGTRAVPRPTGAPPGRAPASPVASRAHLRVPRPPSKSRAPW